MYYTDITLPPPVVSICRALGEEEILIFVACLSGLFDLSECKVKRVIEGKLFTKVKNNLCFHRNVV